MKSLLLDLDAQLVELVRPMVEEYGLEIVSGAMHWTADNMQQAAADLRGEANLAIQLQLDAEDLDSIVRLPILSAETYDSLEYLLS